MVWGRRLADRGVSGVAHDPLAIFEGQRAASLLLHGYLLVCMVLQGHKKFDCGPHPKAPTKLNSLQGLSAASAQVFPSPSVHAMSMHTVCLGDPTRLTEHEGTSFKHLM